MKIRVGMAESWALDDFGDVGDDPEGHYEGTEVEVPDELVTAWRATEAAYYKARLAVAAHLNDTGQYDEWGH